jgi:hypothetical protein
MLCLSKWPVLIIMMVGHVKVAFTIKLTPDEIRKVWRYQKVIKSEEQIIQWYTKHYTKH